jgi:hypothetical protein
MSESTLSYETEPRGLAIAFGVLIACAGLVPSTIVLVQCLTWASDKPLPTDPISIVPGVMLALWGGWLATHHQRVSVDRHERSLTWQSFVFGFRLHTVSWQRAEIVSIRVTSNGGVKPSGYRAQVCGPLGTRTLRGYFHGSSPPDTVAKTARALGIEIEIEIQRR